MKTKYILIILIACSLWGCKGTKNVSDNMNDTHKGNELLNERKEIGVNEPLNKNEGKTFLDSIRAGFIKTSPYRLDVVYRIIDSLPDYAKKVLPEAIYFTTETIGSNQQFVNVWYKGVQYSMSDFNYLVIKNQTLALDVEDKFKCLLFWKFFNTYEIIEFKKEKGLTNQNKEYDFIAKVKIKKESLDYYITYSNDQFGDIYLFQNEALLAMWPIRIIK